VKAQTVSDVLVCSDKNGIIQRNELKATSSEINDQRDRDEKDFQTVCLAEGPESRARERQAKSGARTKKRHILA
jgi:hypothetical protein